MSKQQLTVPFLHTDNAAPDIGDIASQLSHAPRHHLHFAPWQNAYPYKPSVTFALSYNQEGLYLQYDVKESCVQAAQGKINAPVYQDSCVEFFISFDEGAGYYNFECNCIGTVLAEFGKGKHDREILPESSLAKIRYQSLIRKEKAEELVNWQLTVAIPYEVFLHHQLAGLQGHQCKANFYKCGDLLPEPHFLSWSNIESPEPNFHLPQFFGTLLFE